MMKFWLSLALALCVAAPAAGEDWPGYLDYAYVYSSADAEALRGRLTEYGQSAGIKLENYTAKQFGAGALEDATVDENTVRRAAIAHLLLYLSTGEPQSLEASVDAIRTLEDRLNRHENRYWYHYILAQYAMERGQRFESRCPCSTSPRSAPAAAASAGSTKAACCAWGPSPPGPIRDRPATAAAASGPPAPTRTSCSATSTPDYFAGGTMKPRRSGARARGHRHAHRPALGLDVEEAAAGMYRVINANMAHGVREITIKRGLDPREFPLVVAGGAGAARLHDRAGAGDPRAAGATDRVGTLCATGMLLSDLQHDFVRSYIGPLQRELDYDRAARSLVAEMIAAKASGSCSSRASAPRRAEHEVALDLRYLKQYHEVTLPGAAGAATVARRGSRRDRCGVPRRAQPALRLRPARRGYRARADQRARAVASGHVEKPAAADGWRDGGRIRAHARKRRRMACLRTGAQAQRLRRRTPVYDGHALQAGNEIPGPALIERDRHHHLRQRELRRAHRRPWQLPPACSSRRRGR